MTSDAAIRQPSTMDLLGEVAGAYVDELQRGYLADASTAVAALSQLRGGAGRLPHDVPELWGLTGAERLYQALPGSLPDVDAQRAEAAMFLAVTLYAMHQQSRRDRGMHQSGVALGTAVRKLMPNGEIDEPIRRRFIRVGMATSLDSLAYRLREVVALLRREQAPLDYELLARQIYESQLPGGMRRVRQSWGRSFHAYRPAPASTPGLPDTDAVKENS